MNAVAAFALIQGAGASEELAAWSAIAFLGGLVAYMAWQAWTTGEPAREITHLHYYWYSPLFFPHLLDEETAFEILRAGGIPLILIGVVVGVVGLLAALATCLVALGLVSPALLA